MKALPRALGFFLLMTCAAAVQAQSADQKDLIATEDARLAALQKGDATALEQFLADDLTYIRPDGSVWERARYLEAVRSGKLKFTSVRHSQVKTRVIGNTGIVTGHSDA